MMNLISRRTALAGTAAPVAAMAFGSGGLEAQTRPAEFPRAALDRIVEATRHAWDVPGVAVAIVHGDDTAYIKGFGVKRMGSSDPVTPDTRFAICSATKPFTTAAMGILGEEGKLRWDDPVRKHLPYFRLSDPLADANVTMRDLVSHRLNQSGNEYLWNLARGSREELIRRIGLVAPNNGFRSGFAYSNIMFVAAGEAVARIAGTTWEDFIARRVFASLGMTQSDFGPKDPATSSDCSTPHAHVRGVLQTVRWNDTRNHAPAGGINSSVRDLTRWMRFQLNQGRFEGKTILKEATIRETHTPQIAVPLAPGFLGQGTLFQSYGLGWFIYDYFGHLVIDHPGLLEGFASTVLLLPKERYGVAILANVGDQRLPEMPGVLKRAILDVLLGLPARDLNTPVLRARRQAEEIEQKQREAEGARRRKDTTPSRAANEYAGSYLNPAYGTVYVRETTGRLELELNNRPRPLEHYQFDTFRVEWAERGPTNHFVQFRMSLDGGRVESVRFLGAEFFRR